MRLASTVAAVGVLMSVWSAPGSAQRSIRSNPPTDDEWRQMREVRIAGLSGDHKLVGRMIEWVQAPRVSYLEWTGTRALSRLGEASALSAIDAMIARDSSAGEARDFARVMRARLVTEAADTPGGTPQSRAQARLQRFLKEADITIDRLNSAAAIQDRDRSVHMAIVYELFALRELADMVYVGRDSALNSACRDAGIRFGGDGPSMLKLQLAEKSGPARLVWLIDYLANVRGLTDYEYYVIQLAADQPGAAAAAADRLVELAKAPRDPIKAHAPFDALISVVHGTGDRTKAPQILPLQSDADRFVRHYAQIMYADIANGVPRTYKMAF